MSPNPSAKDIGVQPSGGLGVDVWIPEFKVICREMDEKIDSVKECVFSEKIKYFCSKSSVIAFGKKGAAEKDCDMLLTVFFT
jgi:hypothetical protein